VLQHENIRDYLMKIKKNVNINDFIIGGCNIFYLIFNCISIIMISKKKFIDKKITRYHTHKTFFNFKNNRFRKYT